MKKKIASIVAVGAMMTTQGVVTFADEATETSTTPLTVAVEQLPSEIKSTVSTATEETLAEVDELKTDGKKEVLPSTPQTDPILDLGGVLDDSTSGDTSVDIPTPPTDGGAAIGNPNSTVDPLPNDGSGISVVPNDGTTTTTEPIQGGVIEPIKPEPKPIPEPVVPSDYSIHSKTNQTTVSEPTKTQELPKDNQETPKKSVAGYPYDELPKTGDDMTVSVLGVVAGLVGLLGSAYLKLKEVMG